MKIATWNVNSIKARLPNVLAWLTEVQPDVVCRRRLHSQNMGRLDRERQRRDYLLTMKAFLDARRGPRARVS